MLREMEKRDEKEEDKNTKKKHRSCLPIWAAPVDMPTQLVSQSCTIASCFQLFLKVQKLERREEEEIRCRLYSLKQPGPWPG
jgi:hypothetical protein